MQKLAFEQAWDKTIAEKDRLEIQRVFYKINHMNKDDQNTVLLRTAYNHKRELLVTVLINNYSNEPFAIADRKIVYEENGRKYGELVSSYSLELPAQTSMPWTFIFPLDCLNGTPLGESGLLTIK